MLTVLTKYDDFGSSRHMKGVLSFTSLRYPTTVNGRSDAPDYHHSTKSPMEPPPSASPSPAIPTSVPHNGHGVPKVMPAAHIPPKLNRKASIERELPINYLRCSPALDSGAGSSRSDSPHSHQQLTCASRASTGQYSPSPSNYSDVAPPAPPPRNHTTGNSATPPPPPPSNQLYKRRSPATTRPAAITPNPTRGTSPVIPQNGIKAQQQLSQQMKALSLYQSNGGSAVEPPPPYPLQTVVVPASVPPPSYTASMQSRQSPTQSQSDYRKSPSSGIYSATSAGSPSPITVTNSAILPLLQPTSVARPQPRVYPTRTQQPIIMQSVKSTQVQKPVLQTAVAPQSPVTASACNSPVHILSAPPSYPQKSAAVVQQQQQQQQQPPILSAIGGVTNTHNAVNKPTPPTPTTPPLIANALNGTVMTTVPTIASPTVNDNNNSNNNLETRSNGSGGGVAQIINHNNNAPPPIPPAKANHSNSNNSGNATSSSGGAGSAGGGSDPPATTSTNALASSSKSTAIPEYCKKIKHASPIPERKKVSKEKEEERKECRIRQYSPQAFKFYMEQHIENVLKSYKQRTFRKNQLEKEMLKIGLSTQTQVEMRNHARQDSMEPWEDYAENGKRPTVINWEKTLHIPPQAKLTREATDLILRLCSSADKRLGKKADEVKAHDFFKGVDFADMRRQKAPYIPKIEHPTDTSNFDPIDPDKLRSDSNISADDFNDSDKPFHGFFEFTFRRFFDDKLNPDMMDDQSPVNLLRLALNTASPLDAWDTMAPFLLNITQENTPDKS
uniref:non-specific serine/threonine protein kinase n=1 Tax=Glossina morsitans morsitans TaxID=37546 RepID=A0A1B0G9E9_GLOMM